MGKYGSGLTYCDVCKLELEEMDTILDKYKVSKEDKENLKGMLIEAYFQASEAAKGGRVLERILEDNGYELKLPEYIEIEREEALKYPFKVK